MCYFITIVVPKDKCESFETLVPRQLHAEHVNQPSIESQLPSNYATYFLSWSGCSCGLFQREIPHRSDPGHLRKKYLRKGWSKSKIDRAVSQSLDSQTVKTDFVGFRPDVASLLEESAGSAGRIGVIVNWMTGPADEEPIPIRRQLSATAEQIHDLVPRENDLLWLKPER